MFADETSLSSADPVVAPDPVQIVPQLIFSELAWAGSSVSASDEWLELYNQTAAVIDLTGFSIWDVAANPAKQVLSIPSGQIGAGGYFLIANNGPDHTFSGGQSVLSITADLIDSDLALSNSTLKLELRDTMGATVDTIGNGHAGFLRDAAIPRAMQRLLTPLGGGSVATSWTLATTKSGLDATAIDYGTPTTSGRPVVTLPNSCRLVRTSEGEQAVRGIVVSDPSGLADIATVTARVGDSTLPTERSAGVESEEVLLRADPATPVGHLTVIVDAIDRSGLTTTVHVPCQRLIATGEILITELEAAPEANGQEFIELQNVGPDGVDLYGWSLDDIDGGGSAPYTIGYSLYLHSGDRIAFPGSETKIKLNNDGDDVQLLSPLGQRVDLVRFSGHEAARSWNRGTPWYWSVPTPGRVNADPPQIEAEAQGGSAEQAAAVARQHLGLRKVLSSLAALQGDIVETEATVAVGQGPYHARRLIVGDDEAFVELQLKEGVNLDAPVGARLHLVARVSTSKTPRLLLGELSDVQVVGTAPRPVRSMESAPTLELTQLVRGQGMVEQTGAVVTLRVGGRSVKLSRAGGVKLPSVEIGDVVTFVGVIIDVDAVQVRIFNGGEVTVQSAAKPALQPSDEPPPTTSPAVAGSSPAPSAQAAPTDSQSLADDLEQSISQIPKAAIISGLALTAELLERRQVLVAALLREVASASSSSSVPIAPATTLLLLFVVSGIGACSAGSSLLESRQHRTVNGP